jgi:hypothetical protein
MPVSPSANIIRSPSRALNAHFPQLTHYSVKGPFSLYDEEGYFTSKFVQELPVEIQDAIRNLTLLTIAPTGTTGSMTPSLLDPDGSESTGIEPLLRNEI